MYRVCDPLYGYIHFDREEQKIIEHPYFQRLRSLQQLGFVQYAYPGATGNRFIHSLGVCHLAGQAFDSVFSGPPSKNSPPLSSARRKQLRKALRLAALLHDIGHGPLSHTGEFLMPSLKDPDPKNQNGRRQARHEDYTLQFIRDSDLTCALKETGIEPVWIAGLLTKIQGGLDFFQDGGRDFLPLLRQIISSDLDVDRMDYIHRDSYFCGVNYGLVDYRWLLSHLTFHEKEKKFYLALNQDALWTAESFLLGRHHIHLTVYFHHKPMVYEKMLQRYRDGSPRPWTLPGDVDSFAQWTDNTLFEKLKAAKDNEWAKRILNKDPYKRVFEWGYFSPSAGETGREERQIKFFETKLSHENIPFISANSSDHPLKPTLSAGGANSVFVKNRWTGEAKSLFDQQAILKLQKRQIHRIYVDLKDRERAQKLLQSIPPD